MTNRVKLTEQQADKILSINSNPLNLVGDEYLAILKEGLHGVLTCEQRTLQVIDNTGVDKEDFVESLSMVKESLHALVQVDFANPIGKGSLNEDDFQRLYGASDLIIHDSNDVDLLRKFFVNGQKVELTQPAKEGLATIKKVFETSKDLAKSLTDNDLYKDLIKVAPVAIIKKENQLEMNF